MSTYGYIRALPQADIVIREGDTDPIDWTITQGDGVTPVDLTSVTAVILRLRALRGSQAPLAYYSSTPASLPPIRVTTPTLGAIQIVPGTSMAFTAAAESYRGYFDLIVGGSRSVPQERDIWIDVLPRIVSP